MARKTPATRRAPKAKAAAWRDPHGLVSVRQATDISEVENFIMAASDESLAEFIKSLGLNPDDFADMEVDA